jgi:hypothetical protein
MTGTRIWAQAVLTFAAVLGVVGCSSGPSVYPVEGTVSYNGKPMQGGGSIAFVPLGKQEGKTAAGEIDQNGKYTLMTHKPGDGSMIGEFRVVITQVTEQEPGMTQDGQAVAKSERVVPPALRIPLLYSDHHNSPLKAKVEATGKNELNFDLKPVAPPQVQQGA